MAGSLRKSCLRLDGPARGPRGLEPSNRIAKCFGKTPLGVAETTLSGFF